MKTTTKWILGIVISLVLLAALMAIGFLVISRWSGATWIIDGRASQLWDGGRAMRDARGGSVPSSWVTWYCIAVSDCRSAAALGL